MLNPTLAGSCTTANQPHGMWGPPRGHKECRPSF
jgi:hypothetical protein